MRNAAKVLLDTLRSVARKTGVSEGDLANAIGCWFFTMLEVVAESPRKDAIDGLV